MSLPGLDRHPSREERRTETARLLVLVAEATGDEQRRDLVNQVIVVNLGVAQAIARRFRGRGIPDDDLEQVAFTALTRAAQKFDLAQERDFLSYAVPTMSGELKRHFRDNGWVVRPPRRVQEIQSRVIHAYKTGHQDGARPSVARLAQELDLPQADVEEALAVDGCFMPSSLDRAMHPDMGPATLGDSLVSDDSTQILALEARLVLGPVLCGLTDRERSILFMRFVEEKTQGEMGQELGVTQVQVSRLLQRILRDLRAKIDSPVAAA